MRHIERVFIHCSASSNPNITAADVDTWHRKRGWRGIGYHYFIKTDGTLEMGRDLSLTPAAQKGHNKHTVAICLNGLIPTDFTDAQFDTLKEVCEWLNDQFEDITFHGHCEVSAKTCPVFNYKEVLQLDDEGRLYGRK